MTLNAAANAALARRADYSSAPKVVEQPADATPQSFAEIAQAASPSPTGASGVNTALQALTTYIPVEVLTLYVAVIAALGSLSVGDKPNLLGHWIAFGVFFFFTPVAQWVVFATKLKEVGKRLPLRVGEWPKWEMSASTLAYVAWAFALPTTPFAMFAWYSAAIAGVVVLAGSTLLGMVAPLFQRSLQV
jgi:hypothetical protein